jgi:hypothetical protein
MKTWLAVLALVLIAATAFTLDFSVGVAVDYQPFSQSISADPEKDTYRFQQLGAGAFVDGTYFLIGADFVFTIANPSGSVYYNGVKDPVDSADLTAAMAGTKISFLDLTALGKYPFRLGAVTLAPAIGVSYMVNMALTQNGEDLKADMSKNDRNSMSDLFVVGGLIVSFSITKSIFVGVNGLFGWNLTPKFWPDELGGTKYSGWKIKAGLSASYKVASF